MTNACQFIHLETFDQLEAEDILKEAERESTYCRHVRAPKRAYWKGGGRAAVSREIAAFRL